MEFRPCIDIHNGKVKQIVGSSLADEGDRAVENFVAGADAAYYAHLYKEAGLRGGHIILLIRETVRTMRRQRHRPCRRLRSIRADFRSEEALMLRTQSSFWMRAQVM